MKTPPAINDAPQLRTALRLFLLLAVLTGGLYPLVVTGVARVVFQEQAGGEVLTRAGRAIGSRLIGQNFADPRHFWGRPSATTPQPYNALSSNGSNWGPLNPQLTEAVGTRLGELRALDPDNSQPVPVDLVTASASGLDPDISVAAALYQAPRVARVRGIALVRVQALIAEHTGGRLLGVIGEPRVNVLQLNLALDALK